MTEMDILIVEQTGAARVLTLNRPESLNALGGGLHSKVVDALHEADEDDEARVVVLTGAGRGFCSGGDIKGMYQSRVLKDDGPPPAPPAHARGGGDRAPGQ